MLEVGKCRYVLQQHEKVQSGEKGVSYKSNRVVWVNWAETQRRWEYYLGRYLEVGQSKQTYRRLRAKSLMLVCAWSVNRPEALEQSKQKRNLELKSEIMEYLLSQGKVLKHYSV